MGGGDKLTPSAHFFIVNSYNDSIKNAEIKYIKKKGFKAMAINLLDFGAAADGKTLCTKQFQEAISAAKTAGESLLVPPGTFLTGTIDLQGVSMHLEKGAVIKGSPDMKDYPELDFDHNELGLLRALIVCFKSENVCIDGDGVIDLNGHAFYDFERPIVPDSKVPYTDAQKKECTVHHDIRPNQCLFFHEVNNLTIRDITVLNAPCWTFSFNECKNVKTLGLTIDTNRSIPNDDGMHFCSCSDVLISDCHIISGDDCLAFSGITSWDKPCENIVVTNCVLCCSSKAIVLGYVHSHIRNVLIDNVIIRDSHRGLAIMANPKTGLVENVRVSNMIIDTKVRAGNWWGNGEAIFFMGMNHTGNVPASQTPARDEAVNIRNIHLNGITCTSENALGIIGYGKNIDEVYLKDIHFTKKMPENLILKGDIFDVSPCQTVYPVPDNCGLYIEETRSVYLQDITLKAADGRDLEIIPKEVQNLVN